MARRAIVASKRRRSARGRRKLLDTAPVFDRQWRAARGLAVTPTRLRVELATPVDVPKRMNGLSNEAIRPVKHRDGLRRAVHIGNPN